jgi:hypothetical protein
MQEKNDIAETFLERVVAQDNEHVIAWTLYSILYEQKGQELNAEITLKKVLKMNQAHFAELQASLMNTPTHQAQLDAAAEEERKEADEAAAAVAAEEAKANEANKSRNSKRGTVSQQKVKSEGSSKSKSPGIVSKNEDHGQNLKEKLISTELAIKKSIYMTTANFLVKYNAFVVIMSYSFKSSVIFFSFIIFDLSGLRSVWLKSW